MKISGEKIIFEEVIISHQIGIDQPPKAIIKMVVDGIPLKIKVCYYQNRSLIEEIQSLSPFDRPLTEIEVRP